MPIDENKAIARRFIEEIFGKGDLAAVDESSLPTSSPIAGRRPARAPTS